MSMTTWKPAGDKHMQQAGFSLLEALVALAIASVVVGGVAAVHSAQADAAKRMTAKEYELAVAESAMQALFSGVSSLRQGAMAVKYLESTPEVTVRYDVVASDHNRSLVRITVVYGNTSLESSLLLY